LALRVNFTDLYLFLVLRLTVGVHNTEYEVLAEDPGSTIHTLVKTHSSSFASSHSPGGSPGPSHSKAYLRPSTTSSVGAADTKRPFADSTDTGRGSSASTLSSSTQSSADDAPHDSVGMRGVPSANTTASAYLSAALKSGLTGDAAATDGSRPHTPASSNAGNAGGARQSSQHNAAESGTRSGAGVARLSRLSLGMDAQSFASSSVAHSQDTQGSGDLGYARKLEVRVSVISEGFSRV
jgi:hypothetical protein